MNLSTVIGRGEDPNVVAEPEYQLRNLSIVRPFEGEPGHVIAHFASTAPGGTGPRLTDLQTPADWITEPRFEWRDTDAVAQVGEPGDPDYVAPVPAQPKCTLMRTVLLYSPITVPPAEHPAHAGMQAAVVALAALINAGLAALSAPDRDAVLEEAGLTAADYPLQTVEGLVQSQVGVLMIPIADSRS